MTRVLAAAGPRVAVGAVALLLAGCTGGEDASVAAGETTSEAAPEPQQASPAPRDPSPTGAPGGAGGSGGPGGEDRADVVRVSFVGAEPIGPEDAAAVAAGEVPAALRVLDGDSEPVLRTTLACDTRAQRTLEVPVRRNGLLRLRGTARVLGQLAARGDADRPGAASGDVVVLGPRTDLAVMLVRDARGRVVARAAAEQIDERWFVGEVEDCRARVGASSG